MILSFTYILYLLRLFAQKYLHLNALMILLIMVAPLYTTAILRIPSITFTLKPPELTLIAIGSFFAFREQFERRYLRFAVVALLAFLLPLFENLLNFSPVTVWEVESANRSQWWDKIVRKDSLSFTNVTQTLYVVLGLICFLFATIAAKRIPRSTLTGAIISGMLLCTIVGCAQFILFTIGLGDVFLALFSNATDTSQSVTVLSTFMGIKRISATFTETSTYGYYLILSVITLKLLNPGRSYGSARRERQVFFCCVVGLFSTSGTFLIGLLVVAVFFWRRLSRLETYVIYLALFMLPILAFPLLEFAQSVWEHKLGSFNERSTIGFALQLNNFLSNPLFGVGWGTDRATVLLINLLVANGLIGAALLGFAFWIIWSPRVRKYVLSVALLGLTVPDIHFLFLWLYLGLVSATPVPTSNQTTPTPSPT